MGKIFKYFKENKNRKEIMIREIVRETRKVNTIFQSLISFLCQIRKKFFLTECHIKLGILFNALRKVERKKKNKNKSKQRFACHCKRVGFNMNQFKKKKKSI